jgi:ClpP class serine protease
MPASTRAALAAIRAQPWAILPDYLDAIEALAERALQAEVLDRLAGDGHAVRLAGGLEAIAAVGTQLEGARLSTVRDGTAVVPVFGPIFPRANLVNSSAGGTALDAVMRDFRVALASTAVERVLLVFDTPGGVVSGLGEAAEAIRGASKPVTGFVTGIAASAGYWLASQANELVLEPSASVGSIGVVMSMSRQVQPGSDGRRDYEVVSSGAPRKRPDPGTEEGRASIQEEVDAIEAVFIGDVSAGRRKSPGYVRSKFGQGGMVPAAMAVEVGMADRIGTLEATLSGLARRAGPTPSANRRAMAERDLDLRQRRAL